jgi:DNA repair protein RecN (Recombination protein N)
MLIELHIRDFAIIDELKLSFDKGLVTLTGETGAGKSIIIDAVEALLGSRADSTMVRTGADQAIIEGTFQIPENIHSDIQTILEAEDLFDDSDFVIFSRVIRSSGRNTSRINGHVVPAGLQRQIGEYLIDIHGQSDHLSLLRVSQHIELLDRFALKDPNNKSQLILDSYRSFYQDFMHSQQELEELRQAEKDAARLTDLLQYQINEIEAAQLSEDESSLLREERNKLANAEGLAELSQEALELIDGSSPDVPTVSDLLGKVVDSLSKTIRLDPTQSKMEENARLLFDNAIEFSMQLRSYLESLEHNPKRLDQVEERLALIDNLKRKYGSSIREIIQFAEEAKQQLEQITHVEERLLELQSRQDKLREKIAETGQLLSNIRQDTGRFLEDSTVTQLDNLQMKGALLQVSITQKPDQDGVLLKNGQKVAFYPNGLDQVEFMIETNPGEGLKPLAKIASGGETSRLMLALKYVLALADFIPTLIFDEIDQGIGGRIGSIVGRKLWELSAQHQVLCVTHLPQLAAYGSQHFHVEKEIIDDRTITKVNQLSGNTRLHELAQMLGSVSEGTLKSAQELLQAVNEQTQ